MSPSGQLAAQRRVAVDDHFLGLARAELRAAHHPRLAGVTGFHAQQGHFERLDPLRQHQGGVGGAQHAGIRHPLHPAHGGQAVAPQAAGRDQEIRFGLVDDQLRVQFGDVLAVAVAQPFAQRGDEQHQQGDQRNHQADQQKAAAVAPHFFDRQVTEIDKNCFIRTLADARTHRPVEGLIPAG